MIGRRKSPDGLPFRLYVRNGKTTISYGYKLPNNKWEFRLTAQIKDEASVARIRREAIDRAEILNGKSIAVGGVDILIGKYFDWQESLAKNSQERKADITLKVNRRESNHLIKTFGKMNPDAIKPKHIYQYIDARTRKGAPIKANREVGLFSAILEYGRRIGAVEINPCVGIKYNRSLPRTRHVKQHEVELLEKVARERKTESYIRVALCLKAAYLTVSRPDETRGLKRQYLGEDGTSIPVGKRKGGQAPKVKLIEWSPDLREVIREALSIQITASVYIFGNNHGQMYSASGFNTILKRLMKFAADEAAKEGKVFERFTLRDMRPAAVTDRMDDGDENITNATGHSNDRMVKTVYDRRRIKRAKATK